MCLNNGVGRLLLLLYVFFCCTAGYLFGQIKYEREVRIGMDDVPLASKDFVAGRDLSRSRWYKEYDAEGGHTIEVKAWHQGRRLSIEFDESGRLQDIEVQISENDIPEYSRQSIDSLFRYLDKRYRMRRIQAQFSEWIYYQRYFHQGAQDAVATAWNSSYELRYEIEVRMRSEAGSKGVYEFLLDPHTNIISKRKIILRNTDILDF